MATYEVLDIEPDKYGKLAHVVSKYLEDVDETDSDSLVKEFERLKLDIVKTKNEGRAELLRTYCYLQCTNFPLQLIKLISPSIKAQFRDHPYFSTPVLQDELEPIPIESLAESEDTQADTIVKKKTSPKLNELTLENILILLGFTQDSRVQFGLTKMRREIERKLDLIKKAEEADGKASQNDNQEQTVVTKLRQKLATDFNTDELKTLCSDLGIQYENLEGGTRDAKARELVNYCKNRAQLTALIGKIESERPHLTGHFGNVFQIPEALHPHNLLENGQKVLRFVDDAFNYIISFYSGSD